MFRVFGIHAPRRGLCVESAARFPGLLTSHTYLLKVALARCVDDICVAALRVAVQLEAAAHNVVHCEGRTLPGILAAAAGTLLPGRRESE